MRVVAIPCLRDNYAYLLICEATNQAAVIDPSESDPVLAAVAREGVALAAIWNTHHHWDHTGGNKALLKELPELEVIGHESDRDRIPGQTVFAKDGDRATLGEELDATLIFNPGHTTGAISYYLPAHRVVFTGDTLFLSGCGRVFEGTFEMMHASLMRLAALPGETQIYCGHEYTAANLRFAAAVEPDNQAIAARAAEVATIRERGEPTVPGLMADELETNPFLRAEVSSVARAAVELAGEPKRDGAAVFGALRTWKDNFRAP